MLFRSKYQARQPPISGLNTPNRDTVDKSRREKRRTTEATKATVQEDRLSGERVLAGSLAVGKNWGPEETASLSAYITLILHHTTIMPAQRIQPFNLGRHQWTRGSGHSVPYPQAMDILIRSDVMRLREAFEVRLYLVTCDCD